MSVFIEEIGINWLLVLVTSKHSALHLKLFYCLQSKSSKASNSKGLKGAVEVHDPNIKVDYKVVFPHPALMQVVEVSRHYFYIPFSPLDLC